MALIVIATRLCQWGPISPRSRSGCTTGLWAMEIYELEILLSSNKPRAGQDKKTGQYRRPGRINMKAKPPPASAARDTLSPLEGAVPVRDSGQIATELAMLSL